MVNTKYELTRRGSEYTFTNGPTNVVYTALHCHCTLYEYGNGDFRWVGREDVQVYLYKSAGAYEVLTPRQTRLIFFTSGQLEIHRAEFDRTVIMANGRRIEMMEFRNENRLLFEFYDGQSAFRWSDDASEAEAFEPDRNHMSVRDDGSYVSEVEGNSLQIYAPDFRMRRLENGFVRLVFLEDSLQLTLCVDDVFVAKHVLQSEEGGKEKRVCFAHGNCAHIRPSPTVRTKAKK